MPSKATVATSCGIYVIKICQFVIIMWQYVTYTMQFGEYYISNKDSNMLPAAIIDVPVCREEMTIKLLINSSKLCCCVSLVVAKICMTVLFV